MISKINLVTSKINSKNIILNKPVYNFLDIDQKQNILFKLKSDKNGEYAFNYLLIVNNKCQRKLEIICDMAAQSTDIKINFNVLIYEKSDIFVKVKIRSYTNVKSSIDISIEGIIDKDANLSVCPIFDFNHNLINAKHSVKIGNINLHELNYLTSRGIDDVKAKTMLTKSKINIIFQQCDENTKNKYLKLIDDLLEQNHAN